MAKTPAERNADQRRKRAIARTKELGEAAHAGVTLDGLRSTMGTKRRTDRALRGISGALAVGSVAGNMSPLGTKVTNLSQFRHPAETIAQAIASSLDADTQLMQAPSDVTHPVLMDVAQQRPRDAAINPEMLALIASAPLRQWKQRREKAVRRQHIYDRLTPQERAALRTDPPMDEEGRLCVGVFKGRTPEYIAATYEKGCNYLEWMLTAFADLTPKQQNKIRMVIWRHKHAQ